MNWKTTVVLGGFLAVVAGVYFFWNPDPTEAPVEDAPLFADYRAENVTRVELAEPGKVEIVLEHASDGGQLTWRIAKPVRKPANQPMVEEMFFGLQRVRRAMAIKPGTPGYNLELFGLTAPRMIASFHARDKKVTLKFGKESDLHKGMIWMMIEGDPKVYFADVEFLDSLRKDVHQLRSKQLVAFENYRVERILFTAKFLKPKKDDPGQPKFEPSLEESEFFFRTEGPLKGWFITKPFDERLDDMKVGKLLNDLQAIYAEDYTPLSDLRTFGLDAPELKVQVLYRGSDKPITVHVGGFVDKDMKKIYMRVDGSDEVAVVDAKKYEPVPKKRDEFRRLEALDFGEGQCTKIELSTAHGRVVLERRIRVEKKENQEISIVYWEAVEPAGLPKEKTVEEKADGFARSLFSLRLKDAGSWLGEQDLKTANLEKPEITLTFHVQKVKDGPVESKTYYLSQLSKEDGTMKKAWSAEVFIVPIEFVRHMKLLELHFLPAKMFDVDRNSIKEFVFEFRGMVRGKFQADYFRVVFNETTKKWEFQDTESKKAGFEVDPERIADILAQMNYIEAEAFISKEPATAEEYKLHTKEPPTKLTIITKKDGTPKETVLHMTDNLSNKAHLTQYYAKFADSPIVFQIRSTFVDALKNGLVLTKKAENDPTPDHDHGGEKKDK